MAQSSGKVGSADLKETFERAQFRDDHGAFSYRVTPDYRFEFTEQSAREPISGVRGLRYFVGSGAAAQTFLMDDGGFLFESPVTYYGQSESWKASPGFESYEYPYLNRPIVPGCLQCHASGIQARPLTFNAYAAQPFLQGGVACERCHAAGGDHIANGAKMINPAKLGGAARESICEQCHLSGVVRVPKPGRDGVALTPGSRLADEMTVFVRAGVTTDLTVTSHVENFAQSACKRASGDKMWCGTCHDPHTVPEPAVKAAYFRSKCLTCHAVSDCGGTQVSRNANGDSCIACHMPRNPASDVEHVVFTDHAIRRRPPERRVSPAADAELVPYAGYTGTKRDLAVGYAIVALRDSNRVYRARAFELLKQVRAEGGADAMALAYLAEFYRDARDDAHALPLYEEVWREDRSQYAAAAALGAYAMQRGNLNEAIRLWQETLAVNPALTLVRVNLATALERVGRREEARAVVEKALEFNPASKEAREKSTALR